MSVRREKKSTGMKTYMYASSEGCECALVENRREEKKRRVQGREEEGRVQQICWPLYYNCHHTNLSQDIIINTSYNHQTNTL